MSNNTLKPIVDKFYGLHGYLQECIQNFTKVVFKLGKETNKIIC